MSKQKTRATLNKKKSERRITIKLTAWIKDIVANYRVGDTRVSETSIPILAVSLRSSYTQAGIDVLRFDIREFKQIDDDIEQLKEEIYNKIAVKLDTQYNTRTDLVTPTVTATASKLVTRTTQLSVENGWSIREAKRALLNYLKGQRLTVARTESQWVIEATRNTAVLSIKDPLGNTIDQIIRLIESGSMNEAIRLSRRVVKLTKLPASESQATVIRFINDRRDSLTSPVVQGETIASLRNQGRRLSKSEKQWQTVGGTTVRKTHQRANGQIRILEEPFNLDGGELQYPGDSSLGVDLGEIINCRCSTVYL